MYCAVFTERLLLILVLACILCALAYYAYVHTMPYYAYPACMHSRYGGGLTDATLGAFIRPLRLSNVKFDASTQL